MEFQHRAYPIEEVRDEGLLSYEVGEVSEHSDLKIGIEGIFRFNIQTDKKQGVIACTEVRQQFIRMERDMVDEEGELCLEGACEFLEFLEAKYEQYERELREMHNRESRIEKVRGLKGKGGKR